MGNRVNSGMGFSPRQRKAVNRLLDLLPALESADFVPATWPPRFHIDEAGVRHEHMPYPDYAPEVEEFLRVMPAFTADIHPYKALPEDDSQEDVPFSVLGASWPIEYFEEATVDQIRRYFALLHRGERFCDGHIGGEFEAGKVQAALRRLATLLAESGKS